jgi:hypothetical protein
MPLTTLAMPLVAVFFLRVTNTDIVRRSLARSANVSSTLLCTIKPSFFTTLWLLNFTLAVSARLNSSYTAKAIYIFSTFTGGLGIYRALLRLGFRVCLPFSNVISMPNIRSTAAFSLRVRRLLRAYFVRFWKVHLACEF